MGVGRSKPEFDVKQYYGRWYEVARTPNPFQTNCQFSFADYVPAVFEPNGPLTVINTCFYRDLQTRETRSYTVVGQATLNTDKQLIVRFNYQSSTWESQFIPSTTSHYNVYWTDYINYSFV